MVSQRTSIEVFDSEAEAEPFANMIAADEVAMAPYIYNNKTRKIKIVKMPVMHDKFSENVNGASFLNEIVRRKIAY